MLSEPTGSAVVAYVATPEEESVPVPSVVVPSMKVTVPPGVPVLPDAPVTVAVKVTLVPAVMVLAEAVRTVMVDGRVGGGVVDASQPVGELRSTVRVLTADEQFRIAVAEQTGDAEGIGALP